MLSQWRRGSGAEERKALLITATPRGRLLRVTSIRPCRSARAIAITAPTSRAKLMRTVFYGPTLATASGWMVIKTRLRMRASQHRMTTCPCSGPEAIPINC